MVTRTLSVSGGVPQSFTVMKKTYCEFSSRSSAATVERSLLGNTVNLAATSGGMLYCSAQLASVSGSNAEILPNGVFGEASKIK